MKLFKLLRFSNSSQRDDTFIANFKQQTSDPGGNVIQLSCVKRLRFTRLFVAVVGRLTNH